MGGTLKFCLPILLGPQGAAGSDSLSCTGSLFADDVLQRLPRVPCLSVAKRAAGLLQAKGLPVSGGILSRTQSTR